MDACLFCQHLNPDGARFCNDCGTPLDMRPCFACNAVDKRTATHCYQCGAPFTDPAVTASAPQEHAPPPTPEPTTEAPAEDVPPLQALVPSAATLREEIPSPPAFAEPAPSGFVEPAQAADPPWANPVPPEPLPEPSTAAPGPVRHEMPAEPTIVASFAPPSIESLRQAGPSIAQPLPAVPGEGRAAPRTPAAQDRDDDLPRLIVTPLGRDEVADEQEALPGRTRSRQRWFAGAALVILAILAFAVDRHRLRDPVATTTVVTTSPAETGPRSREEAQAVASSPSRPPASAPAPSAPAVSQAPPREAPAGADGACAPAVAALGLCDVGRTRAGR